MKIYTRITYILLIIGNILIFVTDKESFGDKILLSLIFTMMYFLIFMFLIPGISGEISKYYKIIDNDFTKIYKETRNIFKFYLNL